MTHGEVIQKLFRQITTDEVLVKNLREYQAQWFEEKKIDDTQVTQNMCFASFLFDYKVGKKSVLDIVTDKVEEQKKSGEVLGAGIGFDDEEVAYIDGMKKNIYGAFEVTQGSDGDEVELTDVQGGKVYNISENTMGLNLTEGMILFCRIGEYQSGPTIIQFDAAYPADAAYTIKRTVSDLATKGTITSEYIAPHLFPKREEAAEGGQSGSGDGDQGDSQKKDHTQANDEHQQRENPEKQLKKKLVKYLGKKFDFGKFKKYMYQAKADGNMAEVAKEFFEVHADDIPKEEREGIAQGIAALLKNASEEEIEAASGVVKAGPIEKGVAAEHYREVQKHFEKDLKKVEEAAQKADADGAKSVDLLKLVPSDTAVQKFQKKWYETKQKELGDRTPLDAIMEERTQLGHADPQGADEKTPIIPVVSFEQAAKQKVKVDRYNEAVAMIQKGDAAGALTILEEVEADGESETAPVILNLANCYLEVGHKTKNEQLLDKAVERYQKVLMKEPSNEHAFKNFQLAATLKQRMPAMRFEDTAHELSDADLESRLSEGVKDFSKEGFAEESKDAVSAWEVYQKYLMEDRVVTLDAPDAADKEADSSEDKAVDALDKAPQLPAQEKVEFLDVLIKEYWKRANKGAFDFYALEAFVTDRISTFDFSRNTEDGAKEFKDITLELQEKAQSVEEDKRQKLMKGFLQSMAFEFICGTVPQKILGNKAWGEVRFEILDLLHDIWQQPDFMRQKGAFKIIEAADMEAAKEGDSILEKLAEEGDNQAPIVQAVSYNKREDEESKDRASRLAKEIHKNYGEYGMTQEQADGFLKEFKG